MCETNKVAVYPNNQCGASSLSNVRASCLNGVPQYCVYASATCSSVCVSNITYTGGSNPTTFSPCQLKGIFYERASCSDTYYPPQNSTVIYSYNTTNCNANGGPSAMVAYYPNHCLTNIVGSTTTYTKLDCTDVATDGSTIVQRNYVCSDATCGSCSSSKSTVSTACSSYASRSTCILTAPPVPTPSISSSKSDAASIRAGNGNIVMLLATILIMTMQVFVV